MNDYETRRKEALEFLLILLDEDDEIGYLYFSHINDLPAYMTSLRTILSEEYGLRREDYC